MPTEKSGRRPERPPFWVAFGFIAAFAATILTVVLTGLYVRAPGSRSDSDQADSGRTESVQTEPAQAESGRAGSAGMTPPSATESADDSDDSPRRENQDLSRSGRP